MTKQIEQTLRRKVKEHGNDLDLARQTGIDQGTIQRFRVGTRGLSLNAAQKLCDFFKLELKGKQP